MKITENLRRCMMFAMLLNFVFNLSAQVPDGYYDKASGLSEAKLKTALHEIIKVGKRLTYGSGPNKTWSGFEKTDLHPDGYVWDMYSNNKLKFPGNGDVPGGMNIEHSVAKSWWGGSNNDAYKDLYHLNPSNSAANSARSNYPPGVPKTYTVTGTIKVGNNTYGSGFTGKCFEPLDEYKGDFARAYLYMFTCYENLSWTGTAAPSMLNNEKYPMLKPWAVDLLLEWCRMDPVSEKEINRAAAIYEIQNNRNPYIDYPELVEYLWGDKKGEPFYFTVSTDPVLSKPFNGQSVSLPETNYMGSSSLSVDFKGSNLTEDISVSLSGADASLFGISHSVVTASQAMEGLAVAITFHPVKAGAASAVLEISSSEIGERTIYVEAMATEDFQALEPGSITHNSFIANWTPSTIVESFELDVYNKIFTEGGEKVVSGGVFNGKGLEGWKTDGYTDFYETGNGALRLASGKASGSLISPDLNLVAGSTIELVAKLWDSGSTIVVKAGTQTLTTVNLSSDYQTFRIPVEQDYDKVSFSFLAAAGKRLFISSAKVLSPGSVEVKQSLPSYPKIVDGTSCLVEGLESETEYFYTVRPNQTGFDKSEEVRVMTSVSTSIAGSESSDVKIYSSGSDILVKGIAPGDIVTVADISGKVIAEVTSASEEVRMSIASTGFVIISVEQANSKEIFKLFL